jgi:sigma-B regulation protein RsbU (phosphoserine phosphatase)
MRESGLPLGVLPDQEFNELTLYLDPGESLIFYTDGITEAMNGAEEMYGKVRLQTAVQKAPASAKDQVTKLVQSVEMFCGPSPQRDDICVTAVRRLP